MLDEAHDFGIGVYNAWTVEPLLREDFVQIYTAARRFGMLVSVFTNASLLDEAHLDAFQEYPPELVEVSLYGATRATYERVTGEQGSFDRTLHGVHRLLDRGVKVGVKTMILSDNVEEIADIEGLAADLGVPFRLDVVVTPRLDGDPVPLQQRVEPECAVAVELSGGERCSEMARFYERRQASCETGGLPRDRFYYCGAGISSFHIDPRGFVHPCVMSPGIGYDGVSLGFAAAWRAVTAAIDGLVWEGVGGCADCPIIDICGYCPGLFTLEGTTPSRPPEYLCRLGEHRLLGIGGVRPEVVHVGGE